MYERGDTQKFRVEESGENARTLARLIDGSPPVPKNTLRKATGKTSMVLSCGTNIGEHKIQGASKLSVPDSNKPAASGS